MKVLSRERLEGLPGVGTSIAADLRRLNVAGPAALLGETPEELFVRLEELDGSTDRCVLYVFRAARYFVETSDHDLDPELLQWWRWKD